MKIRESAIIRSEIKECKVGDVIKDMNGYYLVIQTGLTFSLLNLRTNQTYLSRAILKELYDAFHGSRDELVKAEVIIERII